MPNSTTTTSLDLSRIPRLPVPPMPVLTPEERQRRADAIERARKNREAIGPIGIPLSELIRQSRDELDGTVE